MDASIEHTDLNTIELNMSNTVRCVYFLNFLALSWPKRDYFNNPYILTVNLCG